MLAPRTRFKKRGSDRHHLRLLQDLTLHYNEPRPLESTEVREVWEQTIKMEER